MDTHLSTDLTPALTLLSDVMLSTKKTAREAMVNTAETN